MFSPSGKENNYEEPEAELRRQALVFLVHILTFLSQAPCLADPAFVASRRHESVTDASAAAATTPTGAAGDADSEDAMRRSFGPWDRPCPPGFEADPLERRLHRVRAHNCRRRRPRMRVSPDY